MPLSATATDCVNIFASFRDSIREAIRRVSYYAIPAAAGIMKSGGFGSVGVDALTLNRRRINCRQR